MISEKNLRIGLVIGGVVLVGLLLVGRIPLSGFLVFGLLLVLCPLMMLGMHGSGRQHSGNSSQPKPEEQSIDRDSQPAAHTHAH
jgi:hypothetical protein